MPLDWIQMKPDVRKPHMNGVITELCSNFSVQNKIYLIITRDECFLEDFEFPSSLS